MKVYNWQQNDWPNFKFDVGIVEQELFLFAEKTGHMTGILKALPDNLQLDAAIDSMVAEAIKSSEIEGEFLSRNDVMSSIKNNLGLNTKLEKVKDKRAEGIGELMVAVRKTFNQHLSKQALYSWHLMLMAGDNEIIKGSWRTHEEPMQIVSGAMGKQKVHFEAPPSKSVAAEINTFIRWFNDTAPGGKNEISKAPVRAAIAHLYFESIHPFEDGNGRIGRAIAEKALSQGIGRPVLLSLSQTIEANKKLYYAMLEKSQRSNEVTKWLTYFIKTTIAAQTNAEEKIAFTLRKAKYFDRFTGLLNSRQLKVIRRMVEDGPAEFEGGMNAGKYVSITKVSKATATRDLQDMLQKGAIQLLGNSGGRSTKYQLNV